MTRRNLRNAFVAVALAGLSGTAAGQTRELVRTIPMQPGGWFTLDNSVGDTIVTGVDGAELTIRATKRLAGRGTADEDALDRVAIGIRERGNRVAVETEYSGRGSLLEWLLNPFTGGRAGRAAVAVDYTVTVPRGAGVTIESISGDVTVEGVDGETHVEIVSGDGRLTALARLVEVKTVSGDLRLTDVRSDDALSVETLNGRIDVEGVRAPRLDVSTMNGAVALRGAECRRVEVRTLSGAVTFAGVLAADGRYEFESHSGDVRLMVPDGSGFDLEAKSLGGDLHSEIPILIGGGDRALEALAFGRGDRSIDGTAGAPVTGTIRGTPTLLGSRSISGTAGDGGARVELSTFSGDVTITAGPSR